MLFALDQFSIARVCTLPSVDSYDASGKLIVCYSYALQILFAIDLNG